VHLIAARFCPRGRVRAHFALGSCGLNCPCQQIPYPHQIVRRCGEGEHPAYLCDAAVHRLSFRDRVQPAGAGGGRRDHCVAGELEPMIVRDSFDRLDGSF
jgi:hypothetical protein